jgi:TfoX/Sxy family transcriptional regulator of competence genes
MDELELQAWVRAVLSDAGAVSEVKMFGGVGFMLNGNLLAGASRRGLLLRVGSEREAEALRQPGARPMVMRGRTMPGYVYVDPPALTAASVSTCLALAVPYVRTLPPKRTKAARRARAAKRNKTARATRAAAARAGRRPPARRPRSSRKTRARGRRR